MSAPAPEKCGARAERGVQVERRDRPARALPVALRPGDQHDRAVEALDEARRDDADHALVPVLARDDVCAALAQLLGPLLDLLRRLAEDARLDGLPVAVQILELVREPARVVGVVGEEQFERSARMTEAPRRIDARAEPEPAGAGIDRCRIDTGSAHQRLQPGLLRARERPEPGDREPAVLVDERHDVGDRREGDEIEMPLGHLRVDAEEGLAELVDDTGAAELRKRIVGRARRDDRAVGQRLARPVMVGDDHVEPACARLGNLRDRGDAAVDREHETAPLVGETAERRARDAVALVEAARQVPVDLGSELAQEEHGERCCRDAVDVVVAVDADAATRRDRGADALARLAHVAEQERVVRNGVAGEERARVLWVGKPAPDENACRELADPGSRASSV